MPRPSAVETRDRLLHAAAAEIVAEGYAGASLSSIAARLGMTKGALAYHFPSKSDVAAALLDHTLGVYARLYAGIQEEGLRGVPALVTVLARIGLLSATDDLFAAGSVLIVGPGTRELDLPPVLLQIAGVYATHLRDAIADGDVRDDVDPQEAAEDILAGTMGMYVFFARHPEREGTRPLRITRQQLTSLGVADADAIVDDVLARTFASLSGHPAPEGITR